MATYTDMPTALGDWIKRHGARALEAATGLHRTTFATWIRRGSMPARWVIPVRQVTGIPVHILAPEIYPPDLVQWIGPTDHERNAAA